MSVIDQFIAKFAPHSCLVCSAEGSLVCVRCIDSLHPGVERCYRCNRTALGFQTCLDCRPFTALSAACSSTMYSDVSKALVHQLKFLGAQAAAQFMARSMLAVLNNSLNTADAVLVPIPTATSRVRQRGYDQAKLLARELAWQAKLPYMDCLARSGQAHQVGASRVERLRQPEGIFRVRKRLPAAYSTIILVDDVMTTGATLQHAAGVLKEAGAQRIEALTFAQA